MQTNRITKYLQPQPQRVPALQQVPQLPSASEQLHKLQAHAQQLFDETELTICDLVELGLHPSHSAVLEDAAQTCYAARLKLRAARKVLGL